MLETSLTAKWKRRFRKSNAILLIRNNSMYEFHYEHLQISPLNITDKYLPETMELWIEIHSKTELHLFNIFSIRFCRATPLSKNRIDTICFPIDF